MIELNILKDRLEKFRRKRVIFNLFIIYSGGLVFILLALSMNFVGNKMQVVKIKESIRKIERNMEKEKDRISYIGEKSEETESLLKSLSFFASESKKRILWTDKIAFIGERVPYGIWLSSLYSNTPGKDEKEPRTITVEGYILPDMVNERAAVDEFVRNLSNANMFETVSLKEVSKNSKLRDDIISFEILCELKKGGK